jgi:acetolactate decarboxylase
MIFSSLWGQHDVLTQISTIDALLNGLYEGQISLTELEKRGNFGIGTFDALDGEMVAVDGQFYQVTSEGSVQIPSMDLKTPFAAVTFFETDNRYLLSTNADFPVVQKEIDDLIPTKNIFFAIRITGSYRRVQTRSVPRQTRPYKMLTEITSNQPVFNFENVEGIIVGFRSPPYVTGINVPGYHLHFLTHDRKAGGHVLDFTVDEAVLEIDETRQFFMILPEDPEFNGLDLTINREDELEEVEQAPSELDDKNESE